MDCLLGIIAWARSQVNAQRNDIKVLYEHLLTDLKKGKTHFFSNTISQSTIIIYFTISLDSIAYVRIKLRISIAQFI